MPNTYGTRLYIVVLAYTLVRAQSRARKHTEMGLFLFALRLYIIIPMTIQDKDLWRSIYTEREKERRCKRYDVRHKERGGRWCMDQKAT